MQKFNKEKIFPARGLQNFGNTCYLNSLVQCLLALSSFNETIEKVTTENTPAKSKFGGPSINAFKRLLSEYKTNGNVDRAIYNIWAILRASGDFEGQQDSSEAFIKLLEIMDKKEINDLFYCRTRKKIKCMECGNFCLNAFEHNTILNINNNINNAQTDAFKSIDEQYQKNMSMNEYISKNNSFVVGYKCSHCGSTKDKFEINTVCRVSSILSIVIKKFYDKKKVPFPEFLRFNYIDGKHEMIYKLVAQSEHSGSISGGHYWAITNCADGVKLCNDSHVENAKLGPTNNSYLIFYHFIGLKKI